MGLPAHRPRRPRSTPASASTATRSFLTKKALKEKAREILRTYKQPALVQHFLPGREFNVGLLGGRKIQVLPLAEVDYSQLPRKIPPIMSYAAKWVETSVEYKKTKVICPARVDASLAALISKTARQGLPRRRAAGATAASTSGSTRTASPCILEVNCNPCLDSGMGLARSAEAAGIDYPQLLQTIVKAAFEGPPYDLHLPIFNPGMSGLPRGPADSDGSAGQPARCRRSRGPGR